MAQSRSQRALLVDFGSTFTKLRLVGLPSGRLIARAQAPSTVQTSIMTGLHHALALIGQELGEAEVGADLRLASSSAAGGLRIAAVGLVQDLTAEAARRAALGAGGKVIRTFAGGLNAADLRALADTAPDMIVLAGGTDGGNTDSILSNAHKLARIRLPCPVVVAGNRAVAEEVVRILTDAGYAAEAVGNVLPSLDRLDVTECADAIRRLFMERIVHSKGLDEAETFVGKILMPTPHAVLLGCKLVSEGVPGRPGLGALMAVDVGGATTDVYSVADGRPSGGGRVAVRGLPEPYVKRTVEGDLGLRVNARSIVDAIGAEALSQTEGDGAAVLERVLTLASRTETLPQSTPETLFDVSLATAAVRIASRRHAGTSELAYGPEGPFTVQTGKNLCGLETLIATGGVFAANPALAGRILDGALFDESAPQHLLPRHPRKLFDSDYLLYAAGLLAEAVPDAALNLALASLVPVQPPAGAS